jgi:hypothetical protein
MAQVADHVRSKHKALSSSSNSTKKKKKKKKDIFPQSPEGAGLCKYLAFSPVKPFWALTSKTVRKHLCCFVPPSVW